MPTQVLPDGRYLPVRDGHRVWWCETGLPGGVPVLVLHGGPGGRTRAAPFSWFHGLPARCIAFDQRGCGRSTPAGGLAHNTLADLVDDAERLREALDVPAWGVAGGSWGALLAVAYAAAHPHRVKGLFLRSAFLGSDAEVARFFEPWPAWLGEAGAAWLGAPGSPSPLALLLPGEASASSAAPGPSALPSAFISPARVAAAWQAFEAAQAGAGGLGALPGARFQPPATATPSQADELPPSLAVQAHFLQHHCFVSPDLVDGWLAALQGALADRPVSLVHGLADAVCHPNVSAALAARWPLAVLRRVEAAGHDMDAPPLRKALTEAAAEWVARLAAPGP